MNYKDENCWETKRELAKIRVVTTEKIQRKWYAHKRHTNKSTITYSAAIIKYIIEPFVAYSLNHVRNACVCVYSCASTWEFDDSPNTAWDKICAHRFCSFFLFFIFFVVIFFLLLKLPIEMLCFVSLLFTPISRSALTCTSLKTLSKIGESIEWHTVASDRKFMSNSHKYCNRLKNSPINGKFSSVSR